MSRFKRNNPGCKCCTPKACTTSIAISFYDVQGTQLFATGFPANTPGNLSWTIQGSTTDGKSISLSGSVSVVGKPWTATFVFSGTQLPEGSYTLHLFSGVSCNGQRRFDCSFPFTVKCPKTVVSGSCQAAFDIITWAAGFGHDGCAPCDLGPMTITGQIPGTICSSTPVSCFGNSCSATWVSAVTSYPDTATFTGSQARYTTETYSVTINPDGTQSPQFVPPSQSTLHSLEQPIQICSYCQEAGRGVVALPDGTVTVSGRYEGSGSPSDACANPNIQGGPGVSNPQNIGVAHISNNPDQTSATITVSHDKFNDAVRTIPAPPQYYTYSYACFAGRDPTGGYTGPPIWGSFACGGCAIPLPWVLHATVFGQGVTLTCNQKPLAGFPTVGNPNQYYWTGRFQMSIPSVTCEVGPDGNNMWDEGGGPVDFFVAFGGLDVGFQSDHVTPGIGVFYRSWIDGNAPFQCPNSNDPTVNRGGWTAIQADVIDYGAFTGAASCDPLMGYLKGVWSYGSYFGGIPRGPYFYNFDASISE